MKPKKQQNISILRTLTTLSYISFIHCYKNCSLSSPYECKDTQTYNDLCNILPTVAQNSIELKGNLVIRSSDKPPIQFWICGKTGTSTFCSDPIFFSNKKGTFISPTSPPSPKACMELLDKINNNDTDLMQSTSYYMNVIKPKCFFGLLNIEEYTHYYIYPILLVYDHTAQSYLHDGEIINLSTSKPFHFNTSKEEVIISNYSKEEIDNNFKIIILAGTDWNIYQYYNSNIMSSETFLLEVETDHLEQSIFTTKLLYNNNCSIRGLSLDSSRMLVPTELNINDNQHLDITKINIQQMISDNNKLCPDLDIIKNNGINQNELSGWDSLYLSSIEISHMTSEISKIISPICYYMTKIVKGSSDEILNDASILTLSYKNVTTIKKNQECYLINCTNFRYIGNLKNHITKSKFIPYINTYFQFNISNFLSSYFFNMVLEKSEKQHIDIFHMTKIIQNPTTKLTRISYCDNICQTVLKSRIQLTQHFYQINKDPFSISNEDSEKAPQTKFTISTELLTFENWLDRQLGWTSFIIKPCIITVFLLCILFIIIKLMLACISYLFFILKSKKIKSSRIQQQSNLLLELETLK